MRRGCPPLGRLLQDAVNGLAGHAKGAGDAGHRFLHALAAADIPYLLRGQARLAALVFALGAGDGNALPLPFPDEGPFKFRHSANDLQMQPLEGRGVIGENEPFLVKTHGHPPVCHILKQMQQIPQIARQSVDAVHMQGIPLPQFRQALLKLGPVGVAAAYGVEKNLVEAHALQLPFRVLSTAADANIADIHL